MKCLERTDHHLFKILSFIPRLLKRQYQAKWLTNKESTIKTAWHTIIGTKESLAKDAPKKITFEMKCQAFTNYYWGSMFSNCHLSNVKGLWLASQCCCQKLPGAATILDTSTLEFLIGFKRVIVWGCALVYSESNTRASKAIWRLFSGHNLSQKIRILCKKTQFKCVKEVSSGIKLWKEDAPSQVSVAGAASPQKKISKDFREPLQGHMWRNKNLDCIHRFRMIQILFTSRLRSF